jgi:hypothetical protein
MTSNGFRISAGPLQGGVGTIQQAIYQAHNSPCGQNKIIFDPVGIAFLPGSTTPLRFIDLKDLLEESMNTDTALEALAYLKEIGTTYLQSASPSNRLLYLEALQDWSLALNASIPNLTIPGYEYRMTIYDSNGNTIFDSRSPTLLPITRTGPNLAYTFTPLGTPNPFRNADSTPKTQINLYGVANNPGYLAFITDRNVQTSSFIVNQAAFPETFMAVSSLLTDPANTRVYGFTNYGFAARQQSPNYEKSDNQGQIGYYACYIFSLFTNPNEAYPESTLVEYIFVRLGLEQAPIVPPV